MCSSIRGSQSRLHTHLNPHLYRCMKITSHLLAKALLGGAFALVATGSALAVPSLTYSSNGVNFSITDGDLVAPDTDALSGAAKRMMFNGNRTVGDWLVVAMGTLADSVSSGSTAGLPVMKLTFQATYNGTIHDGIRDVLTITYFDDTFNTVASSVAGNFASTNGSVAFSSLKGGSPLLSGNLGPGPGNGTASGHLAAGITSLTEIVTLTGATNGQLFSGSFELKATATPDGGTTLALLGLGFAGISVYRRKFVGLAG
jgi:hypothetical protein